MPSPLRRCHVSNLPEYIVSTGIVGGGAPSWATYVRKGRSLRRVRSPKLPLCNTQCEALVDLENWLMAKTMECTKAELPTYQRQIERVVQEWRQAKRAQKR
jgi:endogenous inhibitor of DNA gyrase (YacG/DUF329 family)